MDSIFSDDEEFDTFRDQLYVGKSDNQVFNTLKQIKTAYLRNYRTKSWFRCLGSIP